MKIPKVFSRITKGGLHQIYQPGFNLYNSCWLEGKWLTLPKNEWEQAKDEHENLYNSINSDNQHHNGPSVEIKNMTLAQMKAWQYYSGKHTFECYNGTNPTYSKHQGVSFDMAGSTLSKKSLEWFKRQFLPKGFLVIKLITSYGKVSNQLEGVNLPKEIILNNEVPIDTVKLVIDSNMSRTYNTAENIFKKDIDNITGIGVQLGVHILIELEEMIVREEWKESIGKPDFYANKKEHMEKYIFLRKMAKEKLGSSFKTTYDASKNMHNKCARNNLDNSEGRFYCYVLPKFNDDGIHEPWGPKDVPWNSLNATEKNA
jgi:hypothetical protein